MQELVNANLSQAGQSPSRSGRGSEVARGATGLIVTTESTGGMSDAYRPMGQTSARTNFHSCAQLSPPRDGEFTGEKPPLQDRNLRA